MEQNIRVEKMPTKRTPITRQHRASTEANAWYSFFAWRRDFFRDLWRLGLTEQEIEERAENAWHRLGDRFLRQWRSDYGDEEPWALREFGEP
jgi:hypothetical protein